MKGPRGSDWKYRKENQNAESMRNSIRKIRSEKGLSLVEVLMAVLLLTLSTIIITNAISLGTGLFRRQKQQAQAQMLLDAITVAVQDELRYATGISGNDSGFTYSSRNRAGKKNCRIAVSDTGHIVVQEPDDEKAGTPGAELELVSVDMYGDLVAFLGAGTTETGVADSVPGWDGELFTVSIFIALKTDPTKAIAQKTFTVKPLNPDYNAMPETTAS